MKRRLTALLLLLCLLTAGLTARGEKYRADPENDAHFKALMELLKTAYEKPAQRDEAAEEAELEAIAGISETDGLIARDVADHWRQVYLDPDYRLYMYKSGEKNASELEEAGVEFGSTHAFVVLGYALQDGKMTNELKTRCRAAAAAARSYPDTILVCTGGATGSNNPKKNTEAGLMKSFLVKECGIDADRIFVEDQALSTHTNALNSFRILEEQGIRTVTIVTSDYHQRWGQAVFNAVFSSILRTGGTEIRIVLNYCCKVKRSSTYRNDDRYAASQVLMLLTGN
ncbi:MAG: YdcF family protein [Clostridiales bacterium]|nr:YdcF family protein [Clostridiales bacterium]